jgi:hypothetical protein
MKVGKDAGNSFIQTTPTQTAHNNKYFSPFCFSLLSLRFVMSDENVQYFKKPDSNKVLGTIDVKVHMRAHTCMHPCAPAHACIMDSSLPPLTCTQTLA